MLIMSVRQEERARKQAVWHWGPENVQHYTEPAQLVTNPQDVVLAMAGLLLLHRRQWIVEGWTRVWVDDVFRSRVIWEAPLADVPDADVFPWVMAQVQDYAGRYV